MLPDKTPIPAPCCQSCLGVLQGFLSFDCLLPAAWGEGKGGGVVEEKHNQKANEEIGDDGCPVVGEGERKDGGG